jgi:hypothetical protein
LFLFLIGLACLFPAALYCLFLATVHHRNQPTMIAGQWDFVGVVAALSGFLLVGGTIIVFCLHAEVREYWLVGRSFNDLRAAHARADAVTFAIWGTYFIAVVAGVISLLRLRRRCTAIYQITPAELEEILPSVLDRLNISHIRRGPRWSLGAKDATIPAKEDGARAGQPLNGGSIDVDGSSAMRHVTLRWSDVSSTMRRDIETELDRDFSAIVWPASPASTWFLTAAGCMFTIMIFLLVTFLIISHQR